VGTFCLLRVNVPVQTDCPTCEILPEEHKSPEYVLISQIIAGIQAANKAVDRTGHMVFKGVGANQKYLYNINCPAGMPGGRVIMKDYFPMEFHDIRTREEILPHAFVKSWEFEPGERQVPEKGAGRSGSLFLLSADERYILKTLPHSEVRTMKLILARYQKYIANNPQSRLMRFLAMHRFQVRNNYIYIVVSTNIFYSPKGLRVDIKYDLKGRIPKESTLRHQDKLKFPAKGNVYKDNQLNRKFFPDAASALVANLTKDAQFLASLQCIDYSLLVGVHNIRDDEVSQTENVHYEWSRQYSFSQVHDEVGVGFPSTAVVRQKEVYFFGIIDFLSRYLTKKKCAHFWKTFLWPENTLSTVPEDFYCKRFTNYLPSIILSTDDVKGEVPEDVCGRVSDLKKETVAGLVKTPSFSALTLAKSSSFSISHNFPHSPVAASFSSTSPPIPISVPFFPGSMAYRKSSSTAMPDQDQQDEEENPGPPPSQPDDP
jgi:hypothetical protein